jgi:hypothetical protein
MHRLPEGSVLPLTGSSLAAIRTVRIERHRGSPPKA